MQATHVVAACLIVACCRYRRGVFCTVSEVQHNARSVSGVAFYRYHGCLETPVRKQERLSSWKRGSEMPMSSGDRSAQLASLRLQSAALENRDRNHSEVGKHFFFFLQKLNYNLPSFACALLCRIINLLQPI